MSKINIRIVIDFSTRPNGPSSTRFYLYDNSGDTKVISHHRFRQLLLANGSNINVEVAFGDGHETRDAVGLMDILGTARNTVYARLEPSNDTLVNGKQDIVVYSDQEATEPISRYPWHYSESSPKYGDSVIRINCVDRYLIWLTDLVEEPA